MSEKIRIKGGKVAIRKASKEELGTLIDIYKKAFDKHNIFQKDKNEVLDYLKRKHRSEIGYLIARLDEETVGGILIKKDEISGTHERFSYSHLAVSPDHTGRGIGSTLIEAADEKIKEIIKEDKINTVKIELRVAENEKGAMKFYKKHHFEIEGQLKSHYRHGETTYVLGKELT